MRDRYLKTGRSGLAFRHTHLPLRGKDAIDDGFSPVRGFNDEHIVDDVKDEIQLGHGANQLGFQKGCPFLLQSPLTS